MASSIEMTGIDTAPAPPEEATRESLDRSFVQSVAWTGAVKWLTQLLTWASTFIVARLLTPEDYGLIGMATVYLGLVKLVSEFGLGITVVTLRDLSASQVAQLNSVAIMMGIGAFLISCAMAKPLGWFFDAPELPAVVMVMSLAFLISAFRIVPGALLQKELRFKALSLIEAAQGTVLALGMVLFAWLGFRYWTLVIGGLLGTIILTALTLSVRRHHFSRPRLASLRPALEFTRHQVVGNLSWYAYSNADFLVAGRILGKAQLGVYTFAWSLAQTVPQKVTGMIQRVTPAFFSAIQNDPAELRRYLLRMSEALSIVVFPALIGVALVADDLVPLALGDQWDGVITPLRLLAIYAAYDSVMQLLSRVLTVTGETRFLMRIGITLAIVLPIGFVIGSRWGPVGIAAAWLVVHPLTRVPILLRVFRKIDLRVGQYFAAFWPALSALVPMVIAVLFVKNSVANLPMALGLAAQVLAGAVSYPALLLVFHRGRTRALWRLVRHLRREKQPS